MALKSGFYNAFETSAGVYDREYSADEYTNFYLAFLTDGVRRSNNNDFRCSASGLIITVNAGYAICGSKWVHNETALELDPITPPVGSYSRIDRVFLRVDTTEATRAASLVYRMGTPAENPTPPAKSVETGVTELCLCNVYVAPNAANVTVQDTRAVASLCGWVRTPLDDTLEYNYICNGVTDNETIVDFLDSKQSSVPANGSIKINIFGAFGATNPLGYYVFAFSGWGNRKIILDFANCSPLNIDATNTNFSTFVYTDSPLQLVNLNANLVNVGSFAHSRTKQLCVVNSRITMTMNTENDYSVFAKNGTFDNCVIKVFNGVCFLTGDNTNMIRINNCECYAYGKDSLYYSGYVVFATNAVPVVTNQLNCPTVSVEGYTQKKAIQDTAESLHASYTDTITALQIDAANQNVNGTIPLSAPIN